MASLNISNTNSKPSNLAAKMAEEIYRKYKQNVFYSNVQRQEWSLPDSIIFYMAKNPSSSKVYQKMIQCCKYFFIKNPILVTKALMYFGGQKWYTNYGKFQIDIENIKSKIWITEFLSTNAEIEISTIIPKLYQCDAKELCFSNQNVTYNEFVFLGSGVEEIDFDDVIVTDENDGSIVGLEKLVEVMPAVKRIRFKSETILANITSKTFKELLKIPHFLKLDLLWLNHIPIDFDIYSFYVFMIENQQTTIYLLFDASISDEYKNQLEEIIDEIIETENYGFKIPFLHFPELIEEKTNKLFELFEKNMNF